LSDVEIDKQVERLAPDFLKFLSDRQLPAGLIRELARLYLPLASWLASQSLQALPLIVGVNGAQGSGKSTLCMLLVWLLDHGFGLSCCVVSIDDLYLTRTQRQGLAREIHPLLATRGVPGTHDVELGLRLFETLKCAVADSRTPIPRFDKACDERAPESAWDEFQGRPDLILFEGWCVGAVAQPEALLTAPVNALEANEDGSGVWRSYVNRQLGHEYRALFEQIDLLSMLKIPNWEMVYRWRSNQERQLAASRNGEGIMGSVDLQRFIMHYERLTRYQLEEMPGRADLVLELNRKQEVTQVIKKAATA
jgi:D-glycerate 3-kinase